MRDFLIVLGAMVIFSGCATAKLTEKGQRVRIVTASPSGCKYLGEVVGTVKGSKSGGAVDLKSEHDFTRIDLKNKAAEMGADTVEVLEGNSQWARGEAYNCEKQP